MSLKELVYDYVDKKNTIITSSPGEGCTTLAIYISMILSQKKLVIYFNPSKDIDRNHVKEYFPSTYNNTLFIQENLTTLLEFLNEIDYEFDHIILDPGDSLVTKRNSLISLKKICDIKKKYITITSQIRLDPNMGWKPYSTVEKVNKSNGNTIFDYSIWIRKVTEDNPFFTTKYIDVFKKVRVGNRYISRYLVKFDKIEGCMIT